MGCVCEVWPAPGKSEFNCGACCDCLVSSLPKDQTCPLEVTQKCGDFKYEYQEIQNFMTLGIKNYFLSYKDNGKLNQICKIKGLRLDYSGNIFNEELFDLYLKAFLLNERITSSVCQQHRLADFKKFRSYWVERNVTFSNTICSSRIFLKDNRISSLPYGFS